MSDEEEFEHDNEEEEFKEGEGQIDGFANTMMDILKQETKSKVSDIFHLTQSLNLMYLRLIFHSVLPMLVLFCRSLSWRAGRPS